MSRTLVSKPVSHTFAWLTIAALVAISFVGMAQNAQAQTPTLLRTFNIGALDSEGSLGANFAVDETNGDLYVYQGGSLNVYDNDGNHTGTDVFTPTVISSYWMDVIGGNLYHLPRHAGDQLYWVSTAAPSVLAGTTTMPLGAGGSPSPVYSALAIDSTGDAYTSWQDSTSAMYVYSISADPATQLLSAVNDPVYCNDPFSHHFGRMTFAADGNLYANGGGTSCTGLYRINPTDGSVLNYLPLLHDGWTVDATGNYWVVEINTGTGGNDLKVRNAGGSVLFQEALSGVGWGHMGTSGSEVILFNRISGDVRIYQGPVVTPPLDQCTIDALAAMGLNPGDFPNLESSLDTACMASPDDVTVIEAGSEPDGPIKLAPGEVLVLGDGVDTDNNIIGDKDSENAVYLGNNVTINGNMLKSDNLWVGGIGNLVNNNINHEINVNIGPDAYLRVNGHINDLQNLNIGESGTLDVGGNVDIWVSADIATGALLLVDGNLDCNGSPTVNNNGTVTAGSNNCTLLAALDGGGSNNSGFASMLPVFALATLGLAIYIRPKKA